MVIANSFSRWKSLLWPTARWSKAGTSSPKASEQLSSAWVQRVTHNVHGRDFAVGDIHGCFGDLLRELKGIGFNPSVDRLFSVGDLVDRGPESHHVLHWLNKPWFFAVCGNHDYMAWRSAEGDPFRLLDHRQHGGLWMDALSAGERREVGRRLRALPLAIEVPTQNGLIGLAHAGCPGNDWKAMHRLDLTQLDDLNSAAGQCLWSTQRAMTADASRVKGVHAVVHGHTTVGRHLVLGNVHFIDTGGWRQQGHFTLLNLETLVPAQPDPRLAQPSPKR